MSNVTYEGGSAGNRPVKLTTTNPTVIADGADTKNVKQTYICEISGNTPALSVEVYDGANSVYLIRSKPMTARQTLILGDIPLEKNQQLRVTAGAPNQIDVFAVVLENNPGAGR